MIADVPDLLRLVAVPAFGWAAWRDVKVRRVPNRLWYPLAALGVVLLAWDAWTLGALGGPTTVRGQFFVIRLAVSLGTVVPLAYLFWRFGWFGGADAKALMTLAVLVPSVPWYTLPVGGDPLLLPMNPSPLGVFSLTVFTNAALLAVAYPGYLTVRNLLAGERGRALFIGKRVPVESIPRRHGSLLETPDGYTRRGLDIDALRMYLRWRGVSLSDLRADPDRYRDPASLPEEPNDPTDGALATDGGERVVDEESAGDETRDGDPWGGEAFLDDVESAWGTTPEDLRGGLEVLTTRERVWYSPGMPFVVPMFLGLVVGFVYGDLLFAAMGLAGLA